MPAPGRRPWNGLKRLAAGALRRRRPVSRTRMPDDAGAVAGAAPRSAGGRPRGSSPPLERLGRRCGRDSSSDAEELLRDRRRPPRSGQDLVLEGDCAGVAGGAPSASATSSTRRDRATTSRPRGAASRGAGRRQASTGVGDGAVDARRSCFGAKRSPPDRRQAADPRSEKSCAEARRFAQVVVDLRDGEAEVGEMPALRREASRSRVLHAGEMRFGDADLVAASARHDRRGPASSGAVAKATMLEPDGALHQAHELQAERPVRRARR